MVTGLILSGVLAAMPQLGPAARPGQPAPTENVERAFSGLFALDASGGGPSVQVPATQQAPRVLPPAKRAANPRTKVVCGMTLIVVDAGTDPEMPKQVPKDRVTFPIRRYPPPACGKDERKPNEKEK